MQGGHPDKFVGNTGPPYPKTPESKPKITAEVSVPSLQHVPVGTTPSSLDRVIDWARTTSSHNVALLVASCCGHSGDLNSFRRHKLKRVTEGRNTVLALQKHRHQWYGPLLEKYSALSSFCAEEEFYLLVLPFIFWNLDWLYAHHLLFVVNIGLYVGNVMKDVFCLPRPSNVWRPAAATHADSTGLLDYGFPSTHTMNGVSNSMFTLLFYYTSGYGATQPSLPLWAGILLAAWWTISVAMSRLYMGVHSPTDLRGGVVLGILTAVIWYAVGEKSDALCVVPSAACLLVQVWLISLCTLLCCPQTRPPTPTFLQNGVNMGLIAGNLMGAKLHATIVENAADMHAAWVDLGIATGLPVVRYVLGLLCVLVARGMAKAVVGAVVENVFGLRIKPKEGETQLSLRGLDLAGLATQKFLVYFTLSTGVTAGAPALFYVLGLYEKGQLV